MLETTKCIDATRVLNEALQLAPSERAHIARELLASLHEYPPEDDTEAVEEAWSEEADRRLDLILSGEMEVIPWEQARAQLRIGGKSL